MFFRILCSLHGYYGGLLPGMDVKPTLPLPGVLPDHHGASSIPTTATSSSATGWEGRSIAAPKLRLCEFVAFLEKQATDKMVRVLRFALSNSLGARQLTGWGLTPMIRGHVFESWSGHLVYEGGLSTFAHSLGCSALLRAELSLDSFHWC